jgi:O-antigen ligase
VIWEITLKEWWANPLFGYGPTLWDIDYRIAHGQLEAGQAHNQFVQTLGDSGLLGLLALLSYLMMLFYYAMKYTKESKGVLLALVLVLLLRCFTESPFRLIVFLEPAFLTHLILFTLLVMMQRSDKNCSQQDRENVIKCA